MAKKTTADKVLQHLRTLKKSGETVSVRLGRRNYELLTKKALANGHSLTWLLNYIVDLHFQEEAKK